MTLFPPGGETIANRRVPKEFHGAVKSGHRRGVREYIDDDLAYSLLKKAESGDTESREALAFLTRFNNEYYRGVVKKNDPEALHKTPAHYKAANDAHNARRRDLVSVARAHHPNAPTLMGSLESRNLEQGHLAASFDHEAVIIELVTTTYL